MATIASRITASDSSLRSNVALSLDNSGAFCNKEVNGLDSMEVSIILSLAHMTGWSAELIANKMHELHGTNISPERVWEIYKEWRDAREEDRLDGPRWAEDVQISKAMAAALAINDIEPNYFARALSQTPSPISVRLAGLWYPKKFGYALLEDFTETIRQRCIRSLSWRADEVDLAKPTREELAVLEKLGQQVTSIAKQLLRQWGLEMAQRQSKMPFTRAIEVCPVNAEIIVRYGERFEHEWEMIYGKMDSSTSSWLPLREEAQVYHNLSTGHVSKTFFTVMLYTRLETMQERRQMWRDIIGLRRTPLKELPEDVKDCYICQQPFGVPDDDGRIEMPIQVIACCGNHFGSNCLQRWYGEFENVKCPLCNCRASPEFLNRLFYESVEERSEGEEDIFSASSKGEDGSSRTPTDDDDHENEHRQRDISSHT